MATEDIGLGVSVEGADAAAAELARVAQAEEQIGTAAKEASAETEAAFRGADDAGRKLGQTFVEASEESLALKAALERVNDAADRLGDQTKVGAMKSGIVETETAAEELAVAMKRAEAAGVEVGVEYREAFTKAESAVDKTTASVIRLQDKQRGLNDNLKVGSRDAEVMAGQMGSLDGILDGLGSTGGKVGGIISSVGFALAGVTAGVTLVVPVLKQLDATATELGVNPLPRLFDALVGVADGFVDFATGVERGDAALGKNAGLVNERIRLYHELQESIATADDEIKKHLPSWGAEQKAQADTAAALEALGKKFVALGGPGGNIGAFIKEVERSRASIVSLVEDGVRKGIVEFDKLPKPLKDAYTEAVKLGIASDQSAKDLHELAAGARDAASGATDLAKALPQIPKPLETVSPLLANMPKALREIKTAGGESADTIDRIGKAYMTLADGTQTSAEELAALEWAQGLVNEESRIMSERQRENAEDIAAAAEAARHANDDFGQLHGTFVDIQAALSATNWDMLLPRPKALNEVSDAQHELLQQTAELVAQYPLLQVHVAHYLAELDSGKITLEEFNQKLQASLGHLYGFIDPRSNELLQKLRTMMEEFRELGNAAEEGFGRVTDSANRSMAALVGLETQAGRTTAAFVNLRGASHEAADSLPGVTTPAGPGRTGGGVMGGINSPLNGQTEGYWN